MFVLVEFTVIYRYIDTCTMFTIYHVFVNPTGMKELSPPSVNLKRLLETETLPSEPILIIISPGADPSQELQDLAEQTIGGDKYHQVRISPLFEMSLILRISDRIMSCSTCNI